MSVSVDCVTPVVSNVSVSVDFVSLGQCVTHECVSVGGWSRQQPGQWTLEVDG